MADPLGILGAQAEPAAELVASAVAAQDPVASELLSLQAAWLREGSAASWQAAASRTARTVDPRGGEYRSQIWLGDVFGQNLTVLTRDRHRCAWVYDDDIVSLVDGRGATSPWEANTDAEEALRELLAAGRAPPPREIRLLTFEGTARFARTLQQAGASHLASHLELRIQNPDNREGPLAASFPALRGLACSAGEVDALLARDLPSLRSLVLYGSPGVERLDWCLARAPGLRCLSVRYHCWQAGELDALLALPAIRRLAVLELFDINQARDFPFAALRTLHERWAHLRLLALPGHLVDPAVQAGFQDRGAVCFVGYDRREMLALDFETSGWAETAR